MKYLILLMCMMFLSSCENHKVTPQKVTESLDDFEVVKLFVKDGCTLYRFFDKSHYRYFSSCSGETTAEQPQTCGKSQCPYGDSIPTKRKCK